jgi:hypothetical protein
MRLSCRRVSVTIGGIFTASDHSPWEEVEERYSTSQKLSSWLGNRKVLAPKEYCSLGIIILL